jgi:uncharacterized membrane protein
VDDIEGCRFLQGGKMIEQLHRHIVSELEQNARTDTVFVLTAIILNLVTLGINSGLSRSGDNNSTATIVMFTFVALLVVINFVAEVGLLRGRQMRQKLMNGLLRLYKDNGVDGYYDPSLLGDYRMRYNLYILAVLFSGIVAIVVPFILK